MVQRLVHEPLAGGDPKLLLAAINQAFDNPLDTVRHEEPADALREVLRTMTSEQRMAEIRRLGELRSCAWFPTKTQERRRRRLGARLHSHSSDVLALLASLEHSVARRPAFPLQLPGRR